jgi:spoIIIJ-associated protein
LLEKMHVQASLTTTLSEPDDLTGRRINVIEIHGDDLSTLIGPRGETLNSLQYIARLMAGHKLQQRVGFVIDVEGYRQRREQALSRLAERMARKVAKRKRAMSLEPMPPHERRIIHMTLRDDTYVYTESTGEGNRRKVRIIPKRS